MRFGPLLADANAVIDDLGHGGPASMLLSSRIRLLHNWWSVRCAAAIRGRCWASRLPGTNPMPIAAAPCEPRAVLAEFALPFRPVPAFVSGIPPPNRYLVLPMRPDGTAGMDAAELAALVDRDAMIGTGLPLKPGQAHDPHS